MCARNGCVEAFWLGNLKNRDLKGEELDSSQIVEEDVDDDSNELLDDPDDESDVEVGNNDQDENSNDAPEEESLEYWATHFKWKTNFARHLNEMEVKVDSNRTKHKIKIIFTLTKNCLFQNRSSYLFKKD